VAASITSEVQILMLNKLRDGGLIALVVSNRNLKMCGFDGNGE
jgi:hypothetical protein